MRAAMLATVLLGVVAMQGCAFDEHVSPDGLKYLDNVAVYLDHPESKERMLGLIVACTHVFEWSKRAERDGEIVVAICDKATVDHDWSAARKMMLNAYPADERQAHLPE